MNRAPASAGGDGAAAGGRVGDVHLAVARGEDFGMELFAEIPDEAAAEETAGARDEDGRGNCREGSSVHGSGVGEG